MVPMSATKSRSKTVKSEDRRDIYQEVTDTIISALENGTVPWRKPWHTLSNGSNLHINAASGRPYRGINLFLLEVAMVSNGWVSAQWLTYKQAADLAEREWVKAGKPMKTITTSKGEIEVADKGGVMKGERSTLVVLWKPFEGKEKDEATGEERKVKRFMLRHFNVFNVEQCDRIGDFDISQFDEADEFDPIEAAEKILCSSDKLPLPRFGGNSAYYSPLADIISVPERAAFSSAAAFYSTVWHEQAHATGHKSRLNRYNDDADWAMFGSESYSQEELIAEMTASMVCGAAGIFDDTKVNSAAYIANWLEKLKSDKRFVIQAAAKAQKAADWILNTQPATETQEA